MPKLLIGGYYGFGNIGDEAILYCLINELKNRGYDDITVLSADVHWTQKTYNIKSRNRYSWKEIIDTIRKTDIFILGGGGLLQDITSKRSLIYYLTLVLLSKILRKKVILLSIGVGPIISHVGKILTKLILNKVDLITVRDYESKELLKELGIKKEIYQTADLVFLLAENRKQKIENKAQKRIGLSLRGWHNLNLNKIAYLLNNLPEYEIYFLPFNYNDINIGIKLKGLMNNPSLKIIEDKFEPLQLLSFISNFDIMIAMRYHSIIFSVIKNIPFLPINYDKKIENLVNSLNMNEYLLDLDSDESEFVDKFNKIREEEVEIKNKLTKKASELYNKARENIEIFCKKM